MPALDPRLKAALCALTGGVAALLVLARADLAPAAAARVVERVLEVDRQRGIQHAGKFIHGPIADERAVVTRQVEQEAAAKHDDDWEREQERLERAIAARRVPIFVSPPPTPMPPCDPRETQAEGLRAMLRVLPAHPARPEWERELAEVEAALRSRMPGG